MVTTLVLGRKRKVWMGKVLPFQGVLDQHLDLLS